MLPYFPPGILEYTLTPGAETVGLMKVPVFQTAAPRELKLATLSFSSVAHVITDAGQAPGIFTVFVFGPLLPAAKTGAIPSLIQPSTALQSGSVAGSIFSSGSSPPHELLTRAGP